MSQPKAKQKAPEPIELSQDEVAEYLGTHPEFFSEQTDLLAELLIPHKQGEAISLIEKQIAILRDKNRQLEEQLQSLIQVAEHNHKTQDQLQQLIIKSLLGTDPNEILNELHIALKQDFSVDFVTLRLFSDEQHPLDGISDEYVLHSQSARISLDDITPTAEPLCGRIKPQQLKRFFGNDAEHVNSSVMVPLRKKSLHGLLALGSKDEHRFNPSMDTLYIKRVGEVIAASLSRFTTSN